MGESPLADSVSSGRILATTSPIRNAVVLAGPGSYLKTRVGASWIAGMKVGEPIWMEVPPHALRRWQPFLSIGSTATSTNPVVRRITTPRSAVPLVLRTMTHSRLPDCPPSFTVRRCCPTTTAAFHRHLAPVLAPHITTDPTLARITLAIKTFHQSQRCLSMGQCDQKTQSFRQLSPSRINTVLAPPINNRFPIHHPEPPPDNFRILNSSGDRGRGRRPLALGGAVGPITLPKSWRVTSAEVRTPGPLFWCRLRDRFDPGVTLLRLEVEP